METSHKFETSTHQKIPLRKWKCKAVLEKKKTIHISNLYPECVKSFCKSIRRKTNNSIKNEQKIQTDMSKKNSYEQPINAWKDAQTLLVITSMQMKTSETHDIVTTYSLNFKFNFLA